MRILTACVAVASYPSSVLQPGETPLRYSVRGLQALHEHFCRLWPHDAIHLTFFDEKAQFAAVVAEIQRLVSTARSRLDLFIFVFSGHGRAESSRQPVLCFFPDTAGASEVNSHDIDGLIEQARARQTFLALDACHLAAFAARLRAPSTLDRDTTSCIYFASSRSDELSWEDDSIKKSLFVDGLLHALDRSSYPDNLSAVNFEAVFELVARHVTIAAFHLTRAVQQPLRGGTVQTPIIVPLLDIDIGTRPQTVANALWRRFSRMIIASATSLAVVIGLSLAIMFHTAIGDRGYIQLRAGPAILAPVSEVLVLPPLVETDLKLSDLLPSGADLHGVRSDIREKRISGLWTGTSIWGLRRWGDQAITEWLNDEERTRQLIQLGFPGAQAELKTSRLAGFQETSDSGILTLAEQALLLSQQDGVAPVVTDFLRALDISQPCDTNVAQPKALEAIEQLLKSYGPKQIDQFALLLFDTAIGERQLGSFDLIRSALGFTAIRDLGRSAEAQADSQLARLAAVWGQGRPGEHFDIGSRHVKLLARAIAEQRMLRGQVSLLAEERAWLVGLLDKNRETRAPVL
jgi:hypothetical protein